jgi:K+-transporting ATPase ATPase C chain
MPSAIFGRHLAASVLMLLAVTLGFGFGYPLVVTGLSQLFFHRQADGSLVYVHGRLAGSSLLGQEFTDGNGNPLPRYFQPRPSNAGAGYDGSSSGASNLGPSNPLLIKLVAERAIAYRQFNALAPGAPVPVDAVTASGSGLDPGISVQNALDQAPRVARARHLAPGRVIALVHRYTQGRQLGFIGEAVVDVTELNLALDGQS